MTCSADRVSHAHWYSIVVLILSCLLISKPGIPFSTQITGDLYSGTYWCISKIVMGQKLVKCDDQYDNLTTRKTFWSHDELFPLATLDSYQHELRTSASVPVLPQAQNNSFIRYT